MANKWISYDEWKHLSEWQRKKELEVMPLWLVHAFYAMTVMEIEDNFSKALDPSWLSKKVTDEAEQYKWAIQS